MAWTIEYLPRAVKALKRLDAQMAKTIWKELKELESIDNPRSRGKALAGRLKGLWRYRVGDYRIVCDIQDNKIIILVVDIAHRSKVYRDN